MQNLREKISSGQAVVGVIGLGYVGLPLSLLNARKFKVVGYDIDTDLVHNLRQGHSEANGVSPANLVSIVGRAFFPTSQESDLEKCDIFVICVPTPLGAHNEPDLSAVCDAARLVSRHLRKGALVILESTTYPGTTDSLLVPILEEGGMKAGRDFYVAYSPERIDPGRKDVELEMIPRVVGGHDKNSTIIACEFLQASFERIVAVTDCRTAEATKMLENIFRAVNIALVNELALALERMNISVWEVIEAASTKPFGFMAFWPGPGIGGHCIPLDPYFFSYAAKQVGVLTRFIELSGDVNSFMPFHVVELLIGALRRAGKNLKGSRIAVLGLSYKSNVSDTRESPSVKVIDEIVRHGGIVKTFDPLAKGIQTESGFFQSATSIKSALRDADAAVILVNHSAFDGVPATIFQTSMGPNPVVVDCRNVYTVPPPGTVYVGLGKQGGAQTSTTDTAV